MAWITVSTRRATYVTPRDQSSRNPAIENVKSIDFLRSRKVAYSWTRETRFRVAPSAQSKSVLRTSARILHPVNDMNPTAVADSEVSRVILPMTALRDDKSAKQVNLRLVAGESAAVEAHREVFAECVAIPLCPLGRVVRKPQLIAIWTPKSLTLSCVNKSGTAHGLTQCPITGDTPYFTAVQFWKLRRALQMQRKGQKTFPPQFSKPVGCEHSANLTHQDGPEVLSGAPVLYLKTRALGFPDRNCLDKPRNSSDPNGTCR